MGRLREYRGVDKLKFLTDLCVIASDKEANNKLLRLLCDIDEELLTKVISVLATAILRCVRVLYSDKCPSLHLVTATKVHLHSADASYIQWQRFGNHRSNEAAANDTTVALLYRDR